MSNKTSNIGKNSIQTGKMVKRHDHIEATLTVITTGRNGCKQSSGKGHILTKYKIQHTMGDLNNSKYTEQSIGLRICNWQGKHEENIFSEK